MSLAAPGDSFLTRWSIHLTLFFFMFGMMLQQFVGQNMVLYKVCRHDNADAVCRDMGSHREVQDAAQAESSSYQTLQLICLGLPSAFATLFLGAASDKYGRRKIMIFTGLGVTLFTLSTFYQSTFEGMSTVVIVLGGLATGVSGGILSFIGTVTNYVTDVTPEKERTAALSKVFPFMGLGAMVGTLSAGTLESLLGFQVALGISFASGLVALLMLLFFVKDVLPPQKESDDRTNIWSEMGAGAKCLFEDDSQGARRRKLALVFNGTIGLAFAMSESGLMMLFTKREPFNWTSSTFGFYAAAKQISVVLGQVFGTGMIIKMAGSDGSTRTDFTILQVGTCVTIAVSLITAFSGSGVMLLTAIPLCFLVGPSQSTGGSVTSKLVAADKKGSYSAFTSFLTTFAAPFLSSGFNQLYASSVRTGNPGYVFYVHACLQLLALFALSSAKQGLESDGDEGSKLAKTS